MHASILSIHDWIPEAVLRLREAMYSLNSHRFALLLITLAAIGIVVGYLVYLLRLKAKGVRPLLLPALGVWLLGTVHMMFGIYSQGHTNLFSLFVESASYALDMFIASSPLDYVRGGALPPYGDLVDPQHITLYNIIFATLFVLAILTSIFFVIRLVLRRLSRRRWLRRHRKEAAGGDTSIFFGTDPESIQMAAATKGKAIVICNFEREASFFGLRLGLMHLMDIINVRQRIWNQTLLPDSSKGTVLQANIPLAQTDIAGNPLEQMGLDGLEHWLACPDNKVYLLSEDVEENLRGVRVLHALGTRARVYARIPRTGRYAHLLLTLPAHFSFIDTASLTRQEVISRPELQPVRYVRISEDHGQRLATVESDFRALIVGYGDIGEGLLPFLYTFGSFVGTDGRRSPFHCTIVDPDATTKEGRFWQRHPGIDPSCGIEFCAIHPGSAEFMEWLKQEAARLNYVIVATPSDGDNLTIAIDILEYVHRFRGKDMDHFAVLYHNTGASQEALETEAFYQKNYGRWLHSFGCIDQLWKEENIAEKQKENAVRTFHSNYALASGAPAGSDPWDQMQQAREQGDLAAIKSSGRKIQQNYDNYYHITTKRELCRGPFLETPAVAAGIPPVFEGEFCHFTDPVPPRSREILENLARTEHLRWQSTLEMMGYAPGKKADDVLMTHPCICGYDKLEDPVKFYDWLVVKSALQGGKDVE